MENFLLLFDELDDAIAIFRSMWMRIAGFLVALSSLLVTGFAFRYFPLVALAGVACGLITILALRIIDRRRPLEARM